MPAGSNLKAPVAAQHPFLALQERGNTREAFFDSLQAPIFSFVPICSLGCDAAEAESGLLSSERMLDSGHAREPGACSSVRENK